MDTKTIIGAVIAIVLLTAVVVPIISGMAESTYEKTGTESQTGDPIQYWTEEESWTGTIAASTTGVTITSEGGSAQTIPSYKMALACDGFLVNHSTGGNLMLVDLTNHKTATITATSSSVTYTVTASNGSITFTGGTANYSATYKDLFVFSASATDLVTVSQPTVNNKAYFLYGGDGQTTEIAGFWKINQPSTGQQDVSAQFYEGGNYSTTSTESMTWTVSQSSTGVYSMSDFKIGTTTCYAIVANEYNTYSPGIVTTLTSLIPVLLAVSVIVGVAYSLSKRE